MKILIFVNPKNNIPIIGVHDANVVCMLGSPVTINFFKQVQPKKWIFNATVD